MRLSAGWLQQNIFLRLASVSAALLLMAIASTSYLLQQKFDDFLVERELADLAYEVSIESERLMATVSGMRDDVRTLANTPPIAGLQLAQRYPGDGDNSAAIWAQRLGNIFRSLASTKTDYLSIRLIGTVDGGRELVRIDRYGDTLVTVPQSKLLTEIEPDEFASITALFPGEVYLSQITVDPRHGTNVVRVGFPIYDDNLDVFGYILIQADAAQVFERISARDGVRTTIVDQRGRYLLHPEGALVGGSLGDDFPTATGLLDPALDQTSLTLLHGVGDSAAATHFARVALDPQDASNFILLGMEAKHTSLSAQGGAVRDQTLTITLGMLGLGLVVTLGAARSLSRPISRMTASALLLAEGEAQAPLPTDRKDEIGALARAFEALLSRVQARSAALAASQQRTEAIVEAASDGILVVDSLGRIESANASARAMLGYPPGGLEQVPLAHIVEGLGEGALRQAAVGIRKDGQRFPVMVSVGTFTFHGEQRSTLIVHDTTQAHENLQALEEARDRAERAAEARARFLANMSHEMRTPLNGVIGNAELLLDQPLGDDEKAMTHALLDSARALLSSVNDVLDLTRIDSGAVEVEMLEVDLPRLLQQISSAIRPLVPPGVTFSVVRSPSVPQKVTQDPARLQQILTNLLGNAIKFTAAGHVTLRVSWATDRASALLFTVEDTGIGIPADKLDTIFDSFAQVDASTTRRFGGTGLGLALVRELAELLGGSVSVQSTEGVGSTFSVVIPVRRPAKAPPPPPPRAAAAPPGRPLEVLVAEDNAVNQAVISATLRRLGHTPTVVPDGVEALERLQAEPLRYDVLLLDYHMPRLDGLGAIKAIRALEQPCASVYAIALTASALEEDSRAFFDAGIDAFLTKPLERAALAEALAALPEPTLRLA